MKFLSGCKRSALLVAGPVLLAVLFWESIPAASQNKSSGAKAPCIGCSVDGKTTPRTADGHPDLSGYWNRPVAPGNTRQFERSGDGSILFDFGTNYNEGKQCNDAACADPNEPAYKPEYIAKVKAIAATEYGGTTSQDPQMDCKPLGVPRAGVGGSAGGGIEIVQGPQSVAILYESAPYSLYRIVYTDGRPHPADLDTSYMGHSIGHWEGDTLVVDVAGLSDETWLAGGVATRLLYANIHSDKEHVIERWTRNGDTLTYEATVEDPVMFTRPWVITPQKVKHSGPSLSSSDGMLEQRCTVNDKTHFVSPSADDKAECNYRCTSVTDGKGK